MHQPDRAERAISMIARARRELGEIATRARVSCVNVFRPKKRKSWRPYDYRVDSKLLDRQFAAEQRDQPGPSFAESALYLTPGAVYHWGIQV